MSMSTPPNGSGKYCCTSTSSDSSEMKFASRFVRALKKMRRSRSFSSSSSSSSSIGMKKRSERIKMAAYWCMARAVGSRRAWSRATLWKLGRRGRRRRHQSMMMMRKRKSKKMMKKKRISSSSSCADCNCGRVSVSDVDDDGDEDEDEDDDIIRRETRKLRRVVPGGKCMDICSLLEETADFVRCLHTQLSIMQAIAHHFSNN